MDNESRKDSKNRETFALSDPEPHLLCYPNPLVINLQGTPMKLHASASLHMHNHPVLWGKKSYFPGDQRCAGLQADKECES